VLETYSFFNNLHANTVIRVRNARKWLVCLTVRKNDIRQGLWIPNKAESNPANYTLLVRAGVFVGFGVCVEKFKIQTSNYCISLKNNDPCVLGFLFSKYRHLRRRAIMSKPRGTVQIMQNLERNNILKPHIEMLLRFLCAVARHVSELLETINSKRLQNITLFTCIILVDVI